MTAPASIAFMDLEIKLPELRCYYRKDYVRLSFAETRLLMVFLYDPYNVISSADLIIKAGLTSNDSLSKYVHALRNALQQNFIESFKGFGYRFELSQDRAARIEHEARLEMAR